MKKGRAAAICITLAPTLSGCATTGPPPLEAKAFADAIPLCALLAEPKAYVGRRVLVRGFLTSNPEEREFMDEDCERGVLPLNILEREVPPETPQQRRLRLRFVTYSAWFHRTPPWVPTVYAGVFTDHSPALIAFADHYSLESAELVAVGRPDVRADRRSRKAD
jgi:hypothetical protein